MRFFFAPSSSIVCNVAFKQFYIYIYFFLVYPAGKVKMNLNITVDFF